MDFLRQREFFDPDKTPASVTVVGCGGIGSFTALALAKLGVQDLTLVDPDTVDEHNLPNQMFYTGAVGEPKVSALAGLIADLASDDLVLPRVETHQARLEDVAEDCLTSNVVVSALDSMEAREALWERLRWRLRPGLLLDGRLAGQHVVLYAAKPALPSDVEGYERTLYSDAEALDVSCTARAVIDVGFAVASLIVRAVRLHLAGEDHQRVTYLNQSSAEIFRGGWES